MLQNKHLLALSLVCGVLGSYFISVIFLVLAFCACIYVFLTDSSLVGQSVSVLKEYNFPVPAWAKSVITSLMNSYQLSKPIEPEPTPRRNSPYVPNVPLPRRQSYRSGRYTCLDENTDYVTRMNGISLCTPSSPFSNGYLNSYKRHSAFSDAENSPKIDEFSTPQTSPWMRRQNYSGNELNNIRRVQTVAGPLLVTSCLTKKKFNDFGLYVDANSPGLASRIVQYREDGASTSSIWTHQPQYSGPGQFPMVHLNHSPNSLPVLSPLSSQKASRRSVRVKIAPPDPLGSRLYPLSNKTNTSYTTPQPDHSTKSVIETLKEISRKRIHSQCEDSDDDAVKRQKRTTLSDVLAPGANNDLEDGENMKRSREESPRKNELSPPTRPSKRVRNNEIISSLSSSRKLLQGGAVKRKTHNLDWSRCSTPVLGKQQKTLDEDSQRASTSLEGSLSPSAKKPSAVPPLALSQALEDASSKRVSQKDSSPKVNETRGSENLVSSVKSSSVGKEAKKSHSHASLSASKILKKPLTSPVDESPWQKDSPFLPVTSPDDLIDDVDALEEKREEDRRLRLMSMISVISGGEPPLVMIKENPVPEINTSPLADNSTSDKLLFGLSNPNSNWNPQSTSPSGPPTLLSSQITANQNSKQEKLTSSALIASTAPQSSPPTFTFGSNPTSLSTGNAFVSNSTPTPSTNAVSTAVSGFGVPTQASSQQSPVSTSPMFGTTNSLFGSKTENFVPPQSSSTVSFGGVGNVSFGISNRGTDNVTTVVPSSSATATASVGFGSNSQSPGFQNIPTSGASHENKVSTPELTTSAPNTGNAEQANAAKTITFNAPDKSKNNNVLAPTSQSTSFGSAATPSSTITPSSSFVFGNSNNPASNSSPQIKPGLFAFGSTPTSTANSPPVTSVMSSATNATTTTNSTSGCPTNVFGQTGESLSMNSGAGQIGNSQTEPRKMGGFQFNLTSEKPVFGNQSVQNNMSSGATSNTFGNISKPAVTSESKSFSFGSSKTSADPFALNSANNSSSSSLQGQTSGNVFGAPSLLQKPSEGNKSKENLFSFGAGSTASPVFSAQQSGGFSAPTTATTTAGSGFSFSSSVSSSAASGFAQLASGSGAFSSQPAAAVSSTPSFGTPSTTTTSTNVPFGFSNSVSNPTPQSSPFTFGASASAPSSQPGNLFSFGSNSSPAPSSGGGIFGQPAAPGPSAQPAAPSQTPTALAAPAPAFQFGASSSTQQPSGAFSFGASTSATPPTAASFSSGGFSTGGFSAGPAMFSIGSGSTAPRVRSGRPRRPK